MKTYIFVYGTLKRGFPLHQFLTKARFIGKAYLPGFDMYDLGDYPGIVPGQGIVQGEVYEIPYFLLAQLDEIEEEGEEYIREKRKVFLETGETLEAFVYLYKKDISLRALVKDGTWKKRRIEC